MMLLFNEMWEAGLSQVDDLVFMSDDGSAINKFVEDVKTKHQGVISKGITVKHIKCVTHFLRHIKERLEKEGKLDDFEVVRLLFYYARRSPTRDISDGYMEEIRDISEEVYQYIKERKEYYFISEYTHIHYCSDTNNVSESLMNLLRHKKYYTKSTRNTGIFGVLYRFVLLSFNQMVERKKALNLSKGNTDYNHFCNYVLKELVHPGYLYELLKNRYIIEKFNAATKVGVVKDLNWNLSFTVDFNLSKCSCNLFQNNKYPCIHAIALLHENREYYNVLSYVDHSYESKVIASKIFPIFEDYEDKLKRGINSKTKCRKSFENFIKGLTIMEFDKRWLARRIRSKGEIAARRRGKEKVKLQQIRTGVIAVALRTSIHRRCKKNT